MVYTDHRVVPLEHYVFPSGANGIYLVRDANGKFRDDNVEKLRTHFELSRNSKSVKSSREGTQKDKSNGDVFDVVNLVKEKGFVPVIVFSFSRRECESHARSVSKLSFNDENEEEIVETIFMNALETLPAADRELPQVKSMLLLLKAGVGIHHSGLLPVVKELVEILFQEGLIKVRNLLVLECLETCI